MPYLLADTNPDSIAGVGMLTADQLIATMPELGSLENKQAASLAGLAPRRATVRTMERQKLYPERTRSPALTGSSSLPRTPCSKPIDAGRNLRLARDDVSIGKLHRDGCSGWL